MFGNMLEPCYFILVTMIRTSLQLCICMHYVKKAIAARESTQGEVHGRGWMTYHSKLQNSHCRTRNPRPFFPVILDTKFPTPLIHPTNYDGICMIMIMCIVFNSLTVCRAKSDGSELCNFETTRPSSRNLPAYFSPLERQLWQQEAVFLVIERLMEAVIACLVECGCF